MDNALRSLPIPTLQRIVWYRNLCRHGVIPSTRLELLQILNVHLSTIEVNEHDVLSRFSIYTRSIAGDDVEHVDDETDAMEQWRYENLAAAAYPHGSFNRDSPYDNNNGGAPPPSTSHSNNATGIGGGGGSGGSNPQLPRKKVSTTTNHNNSSFPPLQVGTHIAARDPANGQLMLMAVLDYDAKTRIVLAEDGDETLEPGDKETYQIHAGDLHVLPTMDDPPRPPVLPGTRVLAQFPGTTSFYPALVFKAVRRTSVKAGRAQLCDYYLQFDDDEEGDDGEIIPKKVKGELVLLVSDA